MKPCIDFRSANPTDQIALRGVRVRSLLSGMSQKTTVEMTFVNLEDRAIEAVYTFPLPDDAAVSSFEVITNDRVLTGTIDEREKAIERYDNAIQSGDGAFLMEQDRQDVFNVRVGNLKPKQAATIRLTYVRELEFVDRQLRLSIPTTVAPRYVTSTGTDPLQTILDADAINPPHTFAVPYGMTLEIDIDLGRVIKSLASPSHPMQTELGANHHYKMTCAGTNIPMDRDVIVNLKLQQDVEPAVQIEKGPEDVSYLAVSFVPDFELVEGSLKPAEVTFVIDCSGSMEGQSIQQAKTALGLCLRSMNLGDRFNICRFGSMFEMMSPEPLVYSNDTLKQALRYVENTQAILGGTELHAPLDAILKTPALNGSTRQIILLTDGQISNVDAVLGLAKAQSKTNRIFSFGIGSSASSALVKGLARVTRGAAEFVSENENIADKVLRTFSRLHSPDLRDVEVDWNASEVAQVPATVPPVFDGDRVTVFGRVMGSLPSKLTLRGSMDGKPVKWSVAVPSERVAGEILSTMWGRKRIADLEDQRLTSPSKEIDQQLIAISRKFNLICSLTAFISIEHRTEAERNEGRPALRRVPILLPHAYEAEGACAPSGMVACFAPAPMQAVAGAGGAMPKVRARPSSLGEMAKSFFGKSKKAAPARPASIRAAEMDDSMVCGSFKDSRQKVDEPHSPVQVILSHQTAEGWFDNFAKQLDEFDKVIQQDLLPVFASRAAGDAYHAEITLAVLKVLKKHFASDEPIWRGAFGKALRWLAQHYNESAKATEQRLALV